MCQICGIFSVTIGLILICMTLTIARYFVWDDPAYSTHFLAIYNPFDGGRYLWSFVVAFAFGAFIYSLVPQQEGVITRLGYGCSYFITVLVGYNALYWIVHNFVLFLLETLVWGFTIFILYLNLIIAIDTRNKLCEETLFTPWHVCPLLINYAMNNVIKLYHTLIKK